MVICREDARFDWLRQITGQDSVAARINPDLCTSDDVVIALAHVRRERTDQIAVSAFFEEGAFHEWSVRSRHAADDIGLGDACIEVLRNGCIEPFGAQGCNYSARFG